MKSKISILIVAVLFAWATSAQTTFSVPERTPEQQYNRAVALMHYQTVCAISHGKAMNKSVAETGKYFGNLYKTTWDAAGGFDLFVKGTIFNLNDFAEKVEIMSQSPDKVVIKVTNLNQAFKDQKEIYGVTFKEFVEFYQSSHNQIAELMACTIKFDIINDALEVTIKPLQRKVVLNQFSPYMYWTPQNVNGWVKSIKYEAFEGIEKNGKIVKGENLKPSESNSNYQRINETIYFDKKGNLTSYAEETDQYGNNWGAIFNYKNERVETLVFIKDGIPVSKGDMFYEEDKFIGSDWLSFEDNELTHKWRVETDKHGNVNFRKGFNKNDVITSQGPKLIRDENGVALEQSILKKDGTVDRQVKISYDDNGLPIEFHRTINNGNKVDERFKCEYEFDKNGNWVKQIQYGPPAGKNFIVERTITFYEKR